MIVVLKVFPTLIGGNVRASERIMSTLESPTHRSLGVFLGAVHGLFSVMKISLITSLVQSEIMTNKLAILQRHGVG
jgi:hypothetical protein